MGDGVFHETDNLMVHTHLCNDLDFTQAKWAISLETKVELGARIKLTLDKFEKGL